ncbi:MAG: hypothetical protein RBJ76_21605 [Stenomitos frigidus ULC029]
MLTKLLRAAVITALLTVLAQDWLLPTQPQTATNRSFRQADSNHKLP